MNCQICGNKGRRCPSKHQVLCKGCHQETPPKVSRSCFEAVYFACDTIGEVSQAIRREFYADYLASRDTLAGYIAATSVQA